MSHVTSNQSHYDSSPRRITIDKYDKNTVITVRRCERPDTAKYRLVLTNTSGSCEGEADVVVLGKTSERGRGPGVPNLNEEALGRTKSGMPQHCMFRNTRKYCGSV